MYTSFDVVIPVCFSTFVTSQITRELIASMKSMEDSRPVNVNMKSETVLNHLPGVELMNEVFICRSHGRHCGLVDCDSAKCENGGE